MRKIIVTAIAGALLGAVTSVWAVPTTGSIQFGGISWLNPLASNGGVPTHLHQAGYLDFDESLSSHAVATGVHGDFAGVVSPIGGVSFDLFQFSDFDLSAFSSGFEFWQGADLSFSVTSVDDIVRQAGADRLVLSGSGNLGDMDSQLSGHWELSLNNSGAVFSWQAEVPEPGSLALLGLGLAGLGLSRRMQKA